MFRCQDVKIVVVFGNMPVHKLALTMFHPIPVDLIQVLLLLYFVSQLRDQSIIKTHVAYKCFFILTDERERL